MKKKLSIVLSLILAFAMILCTACGGDTTTDPAATPDAPESVVFRVGTGGNTGTYYGFTTAACQILNTDAYTFEVLATGGSQANIEGIEDGDYQMAIVQNDVMNYAYAGTNGFASQIKSFSAIGCVYPEVCQIVATKASGISSVADLKGKTVVVGDVGSGVYYNATQILAAAGLDIDKDINKVAGSFGDAAKQLSDGSIDAAFITAGTPTPAVTELATSTEVIVVDLGEEVISKLMAEYPFYAKYEITNADYGFIS
jgi:TRAP transporter TAXI family solute receptor